jgi:hypothetical protein
MRSWATRPRQYAVSVAILGALSLSTMSKLPVCPVNAYSNSRTLHRAPSAHQLESIDDLLAERAHVDHAGGFAGEFVFTQWNRVAEHQCIDDPDGGRLHYPNAPFVWVKRNAHDDEPMTFTIGHLTQLRVTRTLG